MSVPAKPRRPKLPARAGPRREVPDTLEGQRAYWRRSLDRLARYLREVQRQELRRGHET